MSGRMTLFTTPSTPWRDYDSIALLHIGTVPPLGMSTYEQAMTPDFKLTMIWICCESLEFSRCCLCSLTLDPTSTSESLSPGLRRCQSLSILAGATGIRNLPLRSLGLTFLKSWSLGDQDMNAAVASLRGRWKKEKGTVSHIPRSSSKLWGSPLLG